MTQNSVHLRVRPNETQLSAVQAHQLAREIESQPMTRHLVTRARAMEAFENIGLFLGGNAASGIRHPQLYLAIELPRDNADDSARSIILAGVIEQILHDERRDI